MLLLLRCDHCDATLGNDYVERDRKRFCCADCNKAFDRGELKAISPHAHHELEAAILSAPAASRGR